MALTRIWSAFIIIAILVAGIKFFAVDGEQQIFTQMVIGKSGDTLKVREVTRESADPAIAAALDSTSLVAHNGRFYKKEISEGQEMIATVKPQKVNGIIATCADAVNICIGLIGVLTFFMGFMSIAEKAGGIRLLTRIIAPFFTKLFPDVPKGHPAHGHMMMNFS